MARWTLRDAKNHFSEVVRAARRTPQTVTEQGKPAVVVVDAEQYMRLVGLPRSVKTGKQRTFIEQLLAMPTKEDFEIERAPHRPRDIDL